MSVLEVTGLNAYYADSHILFDVAMRVERNEVVALVGRHGAAKVGRAGANLAGGKSHVIAQAGMQLVPEDRRIFGSLNVEENIILAGLTAPNKWPLERIYQMFPRLKDSRGR